MAPPHNLVREHLHFKQDFPQNNRLYADTIAKSVDPAQKNGVFIQVLRKHEFPPLVEHPCSSVGDYNRVVDPTEVNCMVGGLVTIEDQFRSRWFAYLSQRPTYCDKTLPGLWRLVERGAGRVGPAA